MVFHFPEPIFKLAGICVPRRFLNQEKLARTCVSRISIFSNHVGMFEIHVIPVFVQLSRKQPRKHQFFPEFSSNLEFLCSLVIHNFSEKSRVNEILVQVYFTNLVEMFEIRVIPVLCSIISKNNGENIKILPYPFCRRIRFCDNIFTNNVNICTPLQP